MPVTPTVSNEIPAVDPQISCGWEPSSVVVFVVVRITKVAEIMISRVSNGRAM